MHHLRLASALALALLLPACATVVEGTRQVVYIETSVDGALCALSSDGRRLGVVSSAPGSLLVQKGRADLVVTCSKPGFATATVTQPSSFVPTTFGNILIGGLSGVVTDARSGANWIYPYETFVYLPPLGRQSAMSAVSPPPY